MVTEYGPQVDRVRWDDRGVPAYLVDEPDLGVKMVIFDNGMPPVLRELAWQRQQTALAAAEARERRGQRFLLLLG